MSTKLKLVKCEHMADWYCIERAEHDGRHWFERVADNCSAFMTSARISDADVEGPLAHMRGIAAGIRSREGFEERRCAVRIDGDKAFFSSPRNSIREGEVTLADADDLARQIEEVAP